jgi:hypothetical protein
MAFNSNPKEFNLYANNYNSVSPTNKELATNVSPKNKIMRVIRGGGGRDYNYNSNQNFFFSKMLNPGNIDTLGGHIKPDGKKINLDKLRKEKYEQEMKYLDNDDLNNSKESEIMEIGITETKRAKTPQKDSKGGFFNFFTKIIK